MSLAIEPAKGMVAVEFLDDEEDEQEESYPSVSSGPTAVEDGDYSKGIFAMCLGAGKTYEDKAPGYKRGDTLIVRKSSRRSAVEVDGDGCLISQYEVLGKVKA